MLVWWGFYSFILFLLNRQLVGRVRCSNVIAVYPQVPAVPRGEARRTDPQQIKKDVLSLAPYMAGFAARLQPEQRGPK